MLSTHRRTRLSLSLIGDLRGQWIIRRDFQIGTNGIVRAPNCF
jgi:hypothetical protein